MSVRYLQNGTSGNLRNPPHMAEICHLPGLPQFGTFLSLGHFQVEWLNKLQGACSIATRPFPNTCKGKWQTTHVFLMWCKVKRFKRSMVLAFWGILNCVRQTSGHASGYVVMQMEHQLSHQSASYIGSPWSPPLPVLKNVPQVFGAKLL